MRIERRFILAALSMLSLIATSGCPGTLRDKERFLVDATPGETAIDGADAGGCGDVVTRIFRPQCGSGVCHGAIAPQQGLDLVSASVATRVVGVAGRECAGTLADPAAPETSLLYTKLTAQPPCGAQMPLAQLPLTSADIACVRAWIAAQ